MATARVIAAFETADVWRQWLEKNHAASSGIWMRIFKADSGVKSVSYAGALDEALCFGWIDGQKAAYDATSWLQKFTPRRTKSVWSKRNREHIDRLIAEKRMAAAGGAS